MTSVTRFCLRHKRLVVAGWLFLAVVGALTAGPTAGRLTHSFATPGTAGHFGVPAGRDLADQRNPGR